MDLTQAAPAVLALLALSACVLDPDRADALAGVALDTRWPLPAPRPAAHRDMIETAAHLASPEAGGPAEDGQYVGDFYRMIAAYDGFGPAKAVLDELCATQAPGMILAVYRPGDTERDAWCVARYGEADEFLDITASISERPSHAASRKIPHG